MIRRVGGNPLEMRLMFHKKISSIVNYIYFCQIVRKTSLIESDAHDHPVADRRAGQ
jgi:hypothetical protein